MTEYRQNREGQDGDRVTIEIEEAGKPIRRITPDRAVVICALSEESDQHLTLINGTPRDIAGLIIYLTKKASTVLNDESDDEAKYDA